MNEMEWFGRDALVSASNFKTKNIHNNEVSTRPADKDFIGHCKPPTVMFVHVNVNTMWQETGLIYESNYTNEPDVW